MASKQGDRNRDTILVIIRRAWRRRLIAHDLETIEALQPIWSDPRAPFQSLTAVWLKKGARRALIKWEIDGRPVVIKHYKIKNLDKRIRRAVTPSLAYRSWRGAEKLSEIGLDTPRAWLMIENRFGPLRGQAYIVNDYRHGKPIVDAYLEGDDSDRRAMEAAIGKVFALLRLHRISHRDTKGTNFLWDGKKLWVLDLDSIRYHRTDVGAEYGSRRDRRRFLQNWSSQPKIQHRLAAVIDSAVSAALSSHTGGHDSAQS